MMLESVQSVLTSLRTAIGASIATAFTGFSALLEWLPKDIGTWASWLGMVSTAVLLWIQIRKDHREQVRFETDMAEKERELD